MIKTNHNLTSRLLGMGSLLLSGIAAIVVGCSDQGNITPKDAANTGYSTVQGRYNKIDVARTINFLKEKGERKFSLSGTKYTYTTIINTKDGFISYSMTYYDKDYYDGCYIIADKTYFKSGKDQTYVDKSWTSIDGTSKIYGMEGGEPDGRAEGGTSYERGYTLGERKSLDTISAQNTYAEVNQQIVK